MTDEEKRKAFMKARTVELRRGVAIKRDTAAEVTRLLRLASKLVTAELAAQPSDYQSWYLPRLQQSIQKAIADIGDQVAATVTGGASSAWLAGIDLVEKPLAAAGLKLAGLLPDVDARQLMAMRSFMTDRIKDISITTVNRVNTQLGLVVIGGQTPGDAVKNISGVIDGGRKRAITIVRTEVGRTYSTAAQARQRQASELLPGLKKQWRRSGKIHSRASHDAADGQIVPVNEPFKVGGASIMYPRDPAAPARHTVNCGCESLPFMESWEMRQPGRQPFSDQEIALDRTKRDLDSGLGVP